MSRHSEALADLQVSRETADRLSAFVALLERWQKRTNLVGASTLTDVWTRHVVDSLQLLALAPHAKIWLDIGSGGGFPGIVLAAALADRPAALVHLVERNTKKSAFLREAVRITGGAGLVHSADIRACESLPQSVEVVTARAVAPLTDLLSLGQKWLQSTATGLFLKGQDVAHEVEIASRSWDFDVQYHPSRTGAGKIVEVSRLRAIQPVEAPRP